MNRTILVSLSITFLGVASLAQSTGPVLHAGKAGDPSFRGGPGWGNPPANASNLIFYGGDTNPSDPNVESFANGNTLYLPTTATYGAVTAPTGSKLVATGILFNQIFECNQAPCSGTAFDPATATYDIRAHVTEGNGGNDVASGSGPQTVTATGRELPFFGGVQEFATSVLFTKPLAPTSNVTYWVNESPQCTDSSNSNCSVMQFLVDNTTQQTNGINPRSQPASQIYVNSLSFGLVWENWCDSSFGLNAHQCQYLSFGIMGN